MKQSCCARVVTDECSRYFGGSEKVQIEFHFLTVPASGAFAALAAVFAASAAASLK